jgi:hypothetical protein
LAGSIGGLFFHEEDQAQKRELHSQNGNPSKINLAKMENFRRRKMTVNLPAFHQQSTTNSPSKNHILHTVFAKTPSKNG